MSNFAYIDENGIVTSVIVAEQDIINTGVVGDPKNWIQTSYNTRGGIHYSSETGKPSEDQTKALRKNYAGIGYIYDATRDAFIPPKPFDSWTLNEDTCLYEAPIPYPTDGKLYEWVESTGWVEINTTL
jgi:hypothetical protein